MKKLAAAGAALDRCPLFRGIPEEARESALAALGARRQETDAGAFLLAAGTQVREFGVLLDGRAHVIREEYGGERTVVASLEPGELFAEAFALAGEAEAAVSVLALAPCAVLWISPRRFTAASAGSHCDRLLANLLAVLAEKNLLLNRRIGHLARRTTRDKVLSFLTEQARAAKSREFVIPFNRQELADYLCVERSALSAVLSRLRQEGLLAYRCSRFVLKEGIDEADAPIF